jgi:hypothetical protein
MDEYIRLDTTIIGIDSLINKASTAEEAKVLFTAKDVIYSQQRYVMDAQEKRYCRMIPLEPDCRGYTDVFICTNCHQHIHLGFIRQEYSGSFCLECGAEVMDGDANE